MSQGIRGEDAKQAILAIFQMITVRDKVDPMKAHKALLDITEYRDAIAPDTLPADVPRWVTPSRKRMPVNRRHGVAPKRTTAELLDYWKERAGHASA